MNEATARALVAAYLGCSTLDSQPLDVSMDLSERNVHSQFIFFNEPVTALTAVTLDGDTVGYRSTLPVWELELSRLWTSGILRVQGTTGWAVLPAQLQAAVDLTVAHYAGQTPGVKSETIGRRSVTYQDADGESGLPSHVQSLLRPWKRLML